MRRTARAIIIKDKKILLVTGRDKGHYWTPGGGLEGDETPAQALFREIQEELNVSIVKYEKYSSYDFKNQRVYNFIAEIQGEIMPGEEISKAIWYDSTMSVDISPGFREMLMPKLIEDGLIA